MTPAHLSPTSLAQYIRLENCERYLRFRLVPGDIERLQKRWGLTIQPLTPLLKESGADFEADIAHELASRGETVIDLEKEGLPSTLRWLQEVRAPTILFQPTLEARIGDYLCTGRGDIIRLSRDRQNRLKILVADVKATQKERTEHRLQVAVYARMLQVLSVEHDLPIAEIQGAVLTRQQDGSFPTLIADTPTFDLDTYLSILDRLVVQPDSVVNRLFHQPFESAFYNLSYKCDGCLYNALCMYDSAERLDLSLTPQITGVEKRVLNEAGIHTLPELASLMDLPAEGSSTLQPSPAHQAELSILTNRWPVAPSLPFLVQRARAALRQFEHDTDSRPFIYGASFGTLPSDEEHPGLVKIFFDAQRDYLQDAVYLLSALVVGPAGERQVVVCADQPPNQEIESALIIQWVREVLTAVSAVSHSNQAPVHLYCYNRYDQTVLLEAFKRHLAEIAAIPAFFDLLTQSPALTQPILSFLADEVQERMNMGRVCSPLHDVARWRGFDWKDEQYEYFSLFRARMFDNRRNVIRDPDGKLVHLRGDVHADSPERLTIESASRFNSQIPLEYAYAAWNCLPEDREDSRLLEPFRNVNLEILQRFASMRVKALAHIEASFRNKTRFLNKPPLDLPALAAGTDPIDLARSLQEFLFMEHHTSLQNALQIYSLPIERRVQSGMALLLRFRARENSNLYHFTPEFTSLGLDPTLALNACKLKENDWVILNATDEPLSANQIKHGRLALIESISSTQVSLRLLGITFANGTFRYYHKNNLEPAPNLLYTLDLMADDLNADKALDAIANISGNIFFDWLEHPPTERSLHPNLLAFYQRFTDHIDAFLKNRSRKLTIPQRQAISEQAGQPLVLIQGPPGTGKSYTLAWAILARIAAAAVQGKPCRVLISCKTHNAINVELKALAEAKNQVATFISDQMGGGALRGLEIIKLINDPGDTVAPGARALNAFVEKAALEPLLQKPYFVIGATSGGAYNLMRYRALGGNSVDWTTKTFDLVVIDEASQASLPEGVLACAFLKLDGSSIVVGDHRQMPPIIAHPWKDEQKRSVAASRPFISLFEALVERGFPHMALDESFRLHTEIAEFLRLNIYSKDGIHFHSKRKELIPQLPRLDAYVDVVLDPNYPIVVIEHTEQASQQYNPLELELVRPLIDACVNHLSLDGRNGIGVVVPHRAQKALLRASFPELAAVNSIDTVERFQGDERDVIIVSATASDPDYVRSEADFLLNLNRLNVAISRPRKKLVILASRTVIDLLTSDLEVFEQSVIWKRLYHHYTPDLLIKQKINGFDVSVHGRKAN